MTLTLDQALTGISGILVTPYDSNGGVAPARLAPILDRALSAGLHMPVVNGNTGEFYALTVDEACTMAREVIAMVGDRAPVLAGVGRGIEDAKRIAKVSVERLSVMILPWLAVSMLVLFLVTYLPSEVVLALSNLVD